MCIALCALASFARAAIEPLDPGRAPFTAGELAQGFRDFVVLARPRADRQATAEAEETREGLRVREKFARFRDVRIIELDPGETFDRGIARLRATGRYEFVEPDYIRRLTLEPNDPQFQGGALWALKNTGQSGGSAGADLKATQAWEIVREAPNIIVAVVDSGVNLAHEDIVANLWRNPSPTFGDVNGARFVGGQQSGNPSDDNGHGTHVAGTIGAVGNNGTASTGVAWRVQIMAVKVFSAEGGASVSDIARGVNYAISRGAHIINASYGGESNTGFSNTELAAIAAAREAGVIFVAAAGNDTANMDRSRFYPASHALDNIVTVGASTRRDEPATFSNYGAAVDLFAPGAEIVSLDHSNNTGTVSFSGTSMAAPHVSGALALLKARFPGDTYRQLINRLLRGVSRGGGFAGKAGSNGRLDLLSALTTTSNRPFNDEFAGRPRFTAANLALRASNTGATAEDGEPAHAGFSPMCTLWWEWTAPSAGLLSIDTAGSSYDTLLAVYRGNSLGALTPVAANDDDTGVRTSRVVFTVAAGTTYQIAVDGKGGAAGLTLLNLGIKPANDDFASPIALLGTSAHVTASNAHCSREAGEPRIGEFPGGASLWYRWTAPRDGRFQVGVFSRDFDPILAAYTGSSVATLTLVDGAANAAANDKARGAIWTINATSGVTYAFTVDTKDPRVTGQFTLNLTDSLWQAQVAGAITGAPAVARDGTVYFGSLDRSVYALNSDGTPKWNRATAGMIDTCAPAVADNGTIYMGSNDARLYAFNPDGSQKWAHDFGSNNAAGNSPAIGADGTIYIKPADGYLYALNPADGATKWRFNVHALETYASPAVAPDGTIYQGSDNHNLYAINPDGTQKWVFAADNPIYTVPAIDAAGNLYVGVLGTGKLFSVAPNGTKRWEYTGASLGGSSSPCLSPDGRTVYFGGYDAKLHAVDTATGTARWTYVLGGEVRASSPAVDANGVVYIGCYDFRLYAVNPDGSLKRTWNMGDSLRSSPAIFGNTLYIGANDHKLYAVDIGTGAGGGPWPQYRHNPRRTGRAITELLVITAGPQPQAAVAGQPLTLTVVATGDAPLTYQWFKDGNPIPGATSNTYLVTAATAANAGSYAVTVSSPRGVVTSAPATITVTSPNPGRLINLAVRMSAGSGTQTLIVGFVVTGPKKSLLVRGVGPGLARFGIAGTLADPTLELLAGSTVLAANDDWSGDAAVAQAAVASGAFALDPGGKDAAFVHSLDAAAYTARISGTGDFTGIALAEIYDLDGLADQTLPAGRLSNLSVRAQLNAGGEVLIAGFTLSGNLSKRILVRAAGPSLAQFGVTGRLADPRLELYRNETSIAENDDWGGGAALAAAFARVGAFNFNNGGSFDSALLVTLPAGSYTAQVSGTGLAGGITLVEVYEVPEP